MTFPIPYNSQKDWATKWVQVMKGLVDLSDRQRELVVEILTRYLELKGKILDEEVLWTTLLSTPERKKYQAALTMSPAQFTNILSELRKGDILTTDRGMEQLHPHLIPQASLSFTFSFH